MNDDTAPDINERAVSSRVHAALDEMHEERKAFNRARQAGTLDPQQRLTMQAAVLDVYEELQPYSNRVDKEVWNTATELEVGDEKLRLPDAVAARPRRRRKSVGMARSQKVIEREPRFIDPQDLREISEDLDRIASEMGFEPAPDQQPEDVHGGQI